MDKVSQMIKEMMLSYPALFPSRMATLLHIFTVNGNGYDWNESGCVVPIFKEKRPKRMFYKDLDERDASLKREIEYDLATYGEVTSWKSFWAAKQEAIAAERAQRKRRAKNIDLYASEHVFLEHMSLKLHSIRHFSPKYCILTEAPWGRIDPEWAAAGAETMKAIKTGIHLYACSGLGVIVDEYQQRFAPIYAAAIAYEALLLDDARRKGNA